MIKKEKPNLKIKSPETFPGFCERGWSRTTDPLPKRKMRLTEADLNEEMLIELF